jgi:phosphatidylserine decarboxylase
MIYQRSSQRLIEPPEYGQRSLQFLYGTIIGRMLVRVIASKTISRLNGAYNRTRLSVHKIQTVIHQYSIVTDEFENANFKSFSDFFSRQIKASARPFSSRKQDLISVADAKLTYHKISADLRLDIKNSQYTLTEILQDTGLAKSYAGGTCLVYRLTIDDCHRYIFPDSGRLMWTKLIPGVLHTVQPIAHQKYKPYARNARVVSCLDTDNFGQVVYAEIGALLVGEVHNRNQQTFTKGEEKGYFGLGGSTIVILLKQQAVRVDNDIIKYSGDGIEIAVKSGETIGRQHA